MDQEELRFIISEEVRKILQDDALFKDQDISGILDRFEIPGDSAHHGRNLSYGPEKSTDHEGRATKKQLYYIFTKSQSLYDMLQDDDDLPEWLEAKITKAADYMNSVKDYLTHHMKKSQDD